MLKTCITNVNGLLFVIYAQLLFAKHGHTADDGKEGKFTKLRVITQSSSIVYFSKIDIKDCRIQRRGKDGIIARKLRLWQRGKDYKITYSYAIFNV